MDFIKFDAEKCSLCGVCVEKCPFGALSMGEKGITVGDTCRMCGLCVRQCPEKAIKFEQKANAVDKSQWKDFLVFVEQEYGDIHPVAYELIGEAKKLAAKVGYCVNCVIIGGKGTEENAKKLLPYGVNQVFVYEHPGFEGFRADCYADAAADCIAAVKPSSVLIGATALGRSLAPRLATRFHTGLTADCTSLDIKPNTDMIQIRPAFGGNIMAQISIAKSRPQFATVRYRVMDRAKREDHPSGKIVRCGVTDEGAALGGEAGPGGRGYHRCRRAGSQGRERRKALQGAGGSAGRPAGLYPADGGKRLRRYGPSDRSFRPYGAAAVNYYLRRFGSDPVYFLHERIGMYRGDQHGSGRADLSSGSLLPCGGPL